MPDGRQSFDGENARSALARRLLRWGSMRAWAILAWGGCLGVAGCSGDESGGGGSVPDAGADVVVLPDAGPDSAADAAPDAEPRPANPPLEIDLGTVSSGTAVPVTIPDGALGFHVVVRRAAGGFVGVERVTSPSGQDVVVDYTVVGAGGPSAASNSGVAATTVAQNPLSSAMPLEIGEWQLLFGSSSAGESLDAKVYVQQTDDGEFHGGVLDLHVYLPDGLLLTDPDPLHTVDPSSAAADASMTARIDAFYDALSELYGIDRGMTKFIGIGGEHRVISDYAGLESALAQSQPPDGGTALHVVFANGITVFGQEVWGISAGIPGGAVETGHVASGIALNVSAGFPSYADGFTLVHELGHFAGLFHTSQPDGLGGVMTDPLDDTPECANYPTGCADGKNIMFAAFWGASGGVGIVASDQQRRVVRGSPLYRSYPNGVLAERRSAAPRRSSDTPTTAVACGNLLVDLAARKLAARGVVVGPDAPADLGRPAR